MNIHMNPLLPEGIVDAQTLIPDLAVDLKYAGSNNFIGRPIQGYKAIRVILTKEATLALAAVQNELRPSGLGLLIYDAYRPTQAVDDFIAWSKSPETHLTKNMYYPHITKEEIIEKGYIARKSTHSRGSAIDVTIISLHNNNNNNNNNNTYTSLDMGGIFDFFGERSHADFKDITPQQKTNRLFLRMIMEKHGFLPFYMEWWHFTLANEPYPKTYFNFPIE